MMMQPSTTMMKILAIQYSATFIILRNREESLKPSSLPSKQRLSLKKLFLSYYQMFIFLSLSTQHLVWIVTGTGIVFTVIFYIGTKEPAVRPLRTISKPTDPVV